MEGFRAIDERLRDWLNGDIFSVESFEDITDAHISKIAGVFDGDEVSGQMSLGFQAYDFSYIPLETLSVVYEQFLHSEKHDNGKSKAKDKGAYYTPVHLVNWIASNPPWQETKQKPALEWIKKYKRDFPVGRNQLAEAFAWKVLDHVRDDGAVGMLMPAMSLFKSVSAKFRQNFFNKTDTWAIVNFANLSSVLFAGRAEVPAASFFYTPLNEAADQMITVFSPFRITQPATRGKGNTESWSVTVNGAELRNIRKTEAARGASSTWKIALWGTPRDAHLLESVSARFPSLSQFAQSHGLAIHQGIEIRSHDDKDIVSVPELSGKKRLLMKKLPKERRLFTFPSHTLEIILKEKGYVRSRGGLKSVEVSRAPHVIVDESRRFAVYSNEFIAVPARQIGIAGAPINRIKLKALALYIMSDFARYYEFFKAAQIGVQKSISNLDTLKTIPIPGFSREDLNALSTLYDELVATENFIENLIGCNRLQRQRKVLEKQANEIVYQALGLSWQDRLLVQDLINERRRLLRGKVSRDLLKAPSEYEMRSFIKVLKNQLDDFLGSEDGRQHAFNVVYQKPSAMLEIRLVEASKADTLQILSADNAMAQELAELKKHLTRQHSQWLYFERTLTVFNGDRTYLFKPFERLSWLPSQALSDATDLIAQTLNAEPV